MNIKLIYENLVKCITNVENDTVELDKEIQRQNEINRLNNEIKKLESKIRSEKQFNVKVQYNEEIRKIKRKIDEIND